MGPAQGKESRATYDSQRRRSDRTPPSAEGQPAIRTEEITATGGATPPVDKPVAAAASTAPIPETKSQNKRQTPSGLSSISLRAVQATCNKGEGVATVIKWPNNKPGKVSVEGTFTNWNKGIIELQRSDSEYISLVYLQPGVHAFRYVVDGMEAIDEGQPKIEHEKGLFNTITIPEAGGTIMVSDEESPAGFASGTGPKVYSSADPIEREKYSQTRWQFEETRKLPPLFPPHLRFTPLTSMPPSEGRPTQERVLPTPYHVTINHMYFQAREDYNVIGATYRHGEKYATVVYYRSQEESEKDALRGHADPTLGVSERQFIGTSREQDY